VFVSPPTVVPLFQPAPPSKVKVRKGRKPIELPPVASIALAA
jgi:hypothetical protein